MLLLVIFWFLLNYNSDAEADRGIQSIPRPQMLSTRQCNHRNVYIDICICICIFMYLRSLRTRRKYTKVISCFCFVALEASFCVHSPHYRHDGGRLGLADAVAEAVEHRYPCAHEGGCVNRVHSLGHLVFIHAAERSNAQTDGCGEYTTTEHNAMVRCDSAYLRGVHESQVIHVICAKPTCIYG